MSKGLEIRAQIDAEMVKGLLLLNGGGSAALLALLPVTLGREGFEPLTRAALWGLLLYQLGLAAALVHNRLRRKCSLVYETNDYRPPAGILFWIKLQQPRVCALSVAFMWGSLGLFILAAIRIVVGGFLAL